MRKHPGNFIRMDRAAPKGSPIGKPFESINWNLTNCGEFGILNPKKRGVSKMEKLFDTYVQILEQELVPAWAIPMILFTAADGIICPRSCVPPCSLLPSRQWQNGTWRILLWWNTPQSKTADKKPAADGTQESYNFLTTSQIKAAL